MQPKISQRADCPKGCIKRNLGQRNRELATTIEKAIASISKKINRGDCNRIFKRKTKEAIAQVWGNNKKVIVATKGERKKCQN
ncbi:MULTISPECIES: hypothetical protein [unclassified Microcoleus]|uniref:hypothetical protein n=1 Tax=unclassified Microcoleus TaxID=2642155 RepID=UPI002FCF0D24